MSKKLTNEEFLQKLKDGNIKYMPLEEYKNSRTKIKWLCYKDKRHIFKSRPDKIYDGCGCPYCSGYKAFIGETDLWTTNPEVASLLENHNEGYMYTAYSSHKTNWKCPDCGHQIKNKAIKNVTAYGLRCPICSDSISYSEKFVMSMLMQLNVEFIHDRPLEWSGKKRYDFYIEKQNMIIECHGLQHYEEGFASCNGSRSLQEEKENDLFKHNLAILNNIKNYIVLDCRKSDKNFIRNSILNSELTEIFNLSNIDWDKCNEHACKSYYKDIIGCYNNGMRNPVDIANKIGIGHKSVLYALHKLTDNGICDYDPKRHLSEFHCKKVICLGTSKIYDSARATINDGYSESMVTQCCRNNKKKHKGYHWMYYEDYLLTNKEAV